MEILLPDYTAVFVARLVNLKPLYVIDLRLPENPASSWLNVSTGTFSFPLNFCWVIL